MKKQLCLFAFLFTCRFCMAQNLVPNADFEQYTVCPNNISQLNYAGPWFNPDFALGGGNGTPDYFNACDVGWFADVPYNDFGYQPAYTDSGYAGMFIWEGDGFNAREYIEVPLTSTLAANVTYHFEMHVNLANTCQYTTASIGAYFSDTLIIGTFNAQLLPFTAQIDNPMTNVFDTLNWTLVSGDYVAHGGENYLLIGNFNHDFSFNITSVNTAGLNYIYCYVDGVSVISTATGLDAISGNSSVNVYPNPFNDRVEIKNENSGLSEVILYDIKSGILLKQPFTNTTTLNTDQLASGIYFYEVKCGNQVCRKGKLVKN